MNSPTKRKTIDVILCKFCDGKGYQTEHRITDYHKSEYDVIEKGCYECKGSGRLTRTTTTVLEPFVK